MQGDDQAVLSSRHVLMPKGPWACPELIGTFLEVFLSWSRAARHPQKAEPLPEASHGLQMLPSCPTGCQSPARHTAGPGHHRPVCFHALPHFQAPPVTPCAPSGLQDWGCCLGSVTVVRTRNEGRLSSMALC